MKILFLNANQNSLNRLGEFCRHLVVKAQPMRKCPGVIGLVTEEWSLIDNFLYLGSMVVMHFKWPFTDFIIPYQGPSKCSERGELKAMILHH